MIIPGHTGVCGTLSLTEATVTSETTGSGQLSGTAARVHGDGLADDEAIGDELADGLARVCVGNLAGLVGVEPDLALTAADDGGSQALLSTEIDPRDGVLSAICCDGMTFAARGDCRGEMFFMTACRVYFEASTVTGGQSGID